MIAKYVVTPNLEIVIFSANVTHNTFVHLNPISAGFIRFLVDENYNVTCECFGKSVSLNLDSNIIMDTRIAKRYILCENCTKCGNCEGRCRKDELNGAE